MEHYLNPAFKFDEDEHAALLCEAENVDLVLKGERGNDVRHRPPHSITHLALTPTWALPSERS